MVCILLSAKQKGEDVDGCTLITAETQKTNPHLWSSNNFKNIPFQAKYRALAHVVYLQTSLRFPYRPNLDTQKILDYSQQPLHRWSNPF